MMALQITLGHIEARDLVRANFYFPGELSFPPTAAALSGGRGCNRCSPRARNRWIFRDSNREVFDLKACSCLSPLVTTHAFDLSVLNACPVFVFGGGFSGFDGSKHFSVKLFRMFGHNERQWDAERLKLIRLIFLGILISDHGMVHGHRK